MRPDWQKLASPAQKACYSCFVKIYLSLQSGTTGIVLLKQLYYISPKYRDRQV